MTSTLRFRPVRLAYAVALLLAGLTLAAALGLTPVTAPETATAQGGEGRYSVLVFSRTTGFRHTVAIDAGREALEQMGTDENFDVTLSEDQGTFTDHSLREFDVVVFLNTDGEGILNDDQRASFERWTQRGGGAVRIHADANADKAWEWKTDMQGGGTFKNHPPIQPATVEVADASHPATDDLPATFTWTDEWYNFDADPREDVHVLLTVDESTYTGGEHGEGHPIAWCSEYDGGRNFYTAIGHQDGAATDAWSDANYLAHISGALEWAAGEEPGDCGEPRTGLPTEASLTKVTLDDETENPMELAVANDGRVFFIEIGAGALNSFDSAVKMYDPGTDETYVVGEIPVHRRNENGLLGIALDPDFDANNFVYLYYSVPGPQNEMGTQHLSRFTFDPESGEVGQLDMASEVVLLEIPHQRRTCCHSAGSLAFGPDDNLYLTTADDTTPFQTSGYAPIDARECGPGPGSEGCTLSDPVDARHAFDARRTSGNAADLRGKLIRIDPLESATPEDAPGLGSTYEVDDQNLFTSGQYDDLFPGGTYDPALGRPEIFAMGFRNPFRFTVDPETGWVYLGQVGPDAGNDCFPANGGGCATNPRGPRGYDTINQIREAANMGWPYCLAGQGYYEYDYATQTSGDQYDCEGGPTNDSPLNTGIDTLPPVTEPLIWYPYGSSPEFPEIPPAGARAAMGGPVYHFDPDLDSDVKLSEYYDGKLIWGDWTRNLLMATTLDSNGDYVTSEEFMPNAEFRHPHDIELGPDGAIYIIEWGNNFNFAAQGINPDSGLYRIEQRTGGLPALASAQAAPNSGPAPLEVEFTGELSDRGADDPPTYEWDFDGDGTTDSTEVNPTHTFTEAGAHEVTLTVADNAGTTTDTVTVTATDEAECGPPRSDEFEGDALDTERWEVVRLDEERLSVADGSLNLVSAPADIFQGETGLPNIVLQPLPGGGDEPWSITTEMTWEPTQNFQNAGLMVYGDDDNYIKTGMVWNGSRNFELIKELDGAAEFPGGAPAGDTPSTYFLRLVSSDGNAVVSEFSADGETWTAMGSTDLTGIDDPSIGVYATASTQAGAAEITANFHSVEITPEQEPCDPSCGFSDEFDGSTLDEKWDVRVEDGEPVVAGGELILPILDEIDGTRTGPLSFVSQQVPEGDWTLTTRVTPDLETSWAQAGIMLWQSDGNFVKIVFGRDANSLDRRFEIASDDPTDTRNLNSPNQFVDDSFPDTAWIRASREGNTIMAEFAPDEGGAPGEWQPFGGTRPVSGVDPLSGIEIDPPREGEGVQLGLYAGSDVDGGPYEQEAAFDFARLEPDEPCPDDDTTPPQTSHSLDPASPGEGGTYGGPVGVNLSATDAPAGGGAAAALATHEVNAQPATWNPDELDIALGDEVQWNFPATAQFQHDVWLIEPGDPPDSAGFQVTSGPVPAGGPSVTHTFDQAGAWTMICKIHSAVAEGRWQGMVGTVNAAEGGGGEASGVDYTEYRVNTNGQPGAWIRSDNGADADPFETAFTVSAEGSHQIEYRSVDNAGNAEETGSVSFAIDLDQAGPPADTNPPPAGGSANLDASVKPSDKAAGKRARKVAFRFQVANTGNAASGPVTLCAKAPKKRLKLQAAPCRTLANGIPAGATATERYVFKIKPGARGKSTRVRFTAEGEGLETRSAVAVVEAKD
jgi:glucose/arabinose dehydrogenase/PKD repeat protein/plastocyanin